MILNWKILVFPEIYILSSVLDWFYPFSVFSLLLCVLFTLLIFQELFCSSDMTYILIECDLTFLLQDYWSWDL